MTVVVQTTMFLPIDERTASFAAIEVGKKMGLDEVEVIHTEVMQGGGRDPCGNKGEVPAHH